MRTTLRLLLLALLALATALILSCGPPPVSINDRISDFATSLNGNRSDTYTDCDPSSTDYGPSKTPNFWNGAFPTAGGPYSITNVNSYGSTATMTINNGSGPLGTYTFVMVNSPNMGSDNWLIHSITDPTSFAVFQ
jgi:hypothetical protein